jgi:hypothetical protein
MCALKFYSINLIWKRLLQLASAYSSSYTIIVTINENESAVRPPHTTSTIQVSYSLALLKIKSKTGDRCVIKIIYQNIYITS